MCMLWQSPVKYNVRFFNPCEAKENKPPYPPTAKTACAKTLSRLASVVKLRLFKVGQQQSIAPHDGDSVKRACGVDHVSTTAGQPFHQSAARSTASPPQTETVFAALQMRPPPLSSTHKLTAKRRRCRCCRGRHVSTHTGGRCCANTAFEGTSSFTCAAVQYSGALDAVGAAPDQNPHKST
jgi:hypothetical protein